MEGIKYYLIPKWEKILEPQVISECDKKSVNRNLSVVQHKEEQPAQ